MSIIVDEDKLQVLPSKERERKAKEGKTDLGGGSLLLMRSANSVHTVHRALVHYSSMYQIKGIIKGQYQSFKYS